MCRKTAVDCSAHRLPILPLIVLFLCSCHFDEQPNGIEGSGARNVQAPPPPPSSPQQQQQQGLGIIDLTPSCAPAGAQAFTLTADVRNLVANSVLRWNGSDLPSTVDIAAQQISAQIPAGDVAAAGTAAVTVFNPAPGGGSSSPVNFSIVAGGAYPLSVAVDPTGRFAYVVNVGCGGGFSGSVSMYKLGPAGTLMLLGRVPAGSAAWSIAINPPGTFAYVANNRSKDVSTYTIDPSTGVLVSAGTTPVGGDPWSITIDPSGRFAYLANSLTNDVSMYTADANTGALSSIGPPVQETGPLQTPWDGPNAVAIDPLGKFAYVAIRGDGGDLSNGSVSVYRIKSTTGALTFASSVAGSCGASVSLCGPHAVAVDRSGKFAIAVGAFGGVSLYAIDATTGALTTKATLSAGTKPDTTLPGSVTFHPTGPFVYVTNSGSNEVLEYTIDLSMGTLTSIGTVAAGSAPTSLAIDPSGSFAYVANVGSNDVSIYSIDAVTGALTLLGSIGT